MDQKTFLQHYRICEEDGSPVELGRSGELVTYKAVDTRFSEPVTIKRIPVAGIDSATREQFEKQARDARVLDHFNIAKLLGFGVEDDHFIFVSEYFEGETLDFWIAAHGPMPPEAVLRVAVQVVSALAAARFHGVTHRAIQPSNLVIIPGQTAEGGWPFVKLTNFGLAGLRLASQGEAVRSTAPQFSSPEELQHETADFRSDIYALGATMCFLLTGVMHAETSRVRQLRYFPKPIRRVIAQMLRENPDDRPQDLVVLSEAIRECRSAVERRQEIARKFGLSFVPVIPKKMERPRAWVSRRALAFAVLVLTLATLAAVLLPGDVVRTMWRRNRGGNAIGVPIGVPEPSAMAVVQNSSAVPAPVPVTQPPSAPPSPVPAPSVAVQPKVDSSAKIADATTAAEPEPPTEGPNDEPAPRAELVAPPEPAHESSVATADISSLSPLKKRAQTDSSTTASSKSRSKTAATSSTKRRVTTRRPRNAQLLPDELAPLPNGSFRARVLGTTPDGNVILGLPSGEIAIVRPREPSRRRVRHIIIERRRIFVPPPPFLPLYPPDE